MNDLQNDNFEFKMPGYVVEMQRTLHVVIGAIQIIQNAVALHILS